MWRFYLVGNVLVDIRLTLANIEHTTYVACSLTCKGIHNMKEGIKMKEVYLFADKVKGKWGVVEIKRKSTVNMGEAIYFDTYHEANQYCKEQGFKVVYYRP